MTWIMIFGGLFGTSGLAYLVYRMIKKYAVVEMERDSYDYLADAQKDFLKRINRIADKHNGVRSQRTSNNTKVRPGKKATKRRKD